MSVFRHVSWTATSQMVRQIFQFAVTIVLARMLTPQDYGLLALITVLTGFLTLFATAGLGSAIVQRSSISDEQVSFVFWTNTLISGCLCILVALSAPLIAGFYHEPRLESLVRLMSLGFLPTGLATVPASLLQKNFRFRELAIADTTAAFGSGLLAMYLASRGFGVYTLVLQTMSLETLAMILKWRLCGWRPKFAYDWANGKHLLPYGSNLLGFNAVNYWMRNGDNFLIGVFRGPIELGLYSRAYNLMMLPVVQVHSVLSSVMHPTLSAKQGDHAEFRRMFLLANQSIALIMFPVMLGLFVCADELIRSLLGKRWEGVVPIIQVLSLAGIGNSVGTTAGWIYTAVGRTDLLLRWSLYSAPVLLTAYFIGAQYSAYGVAVAHTVTAYGILWYPQWALCLRLVGLTFGDMMRNLAKPFFASVLMAVVLMGCKYGLLLARVPGQVRLGILVALGAVVYLGLARLLRIPALEEVYGRVRKR